MKVRDFFAGNFSRDDLTKHLGLILIINFFVWMIISSLFFEGYDWTRMDVSHLGVVNINHIGWIFWAISMTTSGLFSIPIIGFLRKNLSEINKFGLNISCLLFYIAAYGSIGLGAFPLIEGNSLLEDLHRIHATMSFVGSYIGFWILFFFLLWDKKNRKQAIVASIITYGTIIGFLISQWVRISLNEPERETFWYLSISMWEWTIVVVVLIVFMYLWYSLYFSGLIQSEE